MQNLINYIFFYNINYQKISDKKNFLKYLQNKKTTHDDIINLFEK